MRISINNHYFRKQLAVITLLFCLLIIKSGNVFATHAAGADFTYRCLGGLQYELTITFYRDCGGVAEPNNITVTYRSASAGVNSTVTATKVAGFGQEITVPCTGASTSCNGGAATGIRQFVYRANVTLPSARADWVFSYSVCCRNCAITTINTPCASSSELYVDATLNNLSATCNNSPTFSNIPIAFVCVGQNFNFNHGVLDADGDSLVYALVAPRISQTNNVTYVAGHSVTTPMLSSTPFTINSLTGDINFTSSAQEIGIMAIRITEYRNGTVIGTVTRDMQVYSTICTNTLPTASGINGTNNYSTTICEGQPYCFNINTNDVDTAQNLTITTNNGIADGSYTITPGKRPTMQFCWTPTAADVSSKPNTFTITVRDNACPMNGIQTFSYNLYVSGVSLTTSSTNVSCNGGTNGTASVTDQNGGTNTYLWSNGATTSAVTGLAAGTYTVTVTNQYSCTKQATVAITQPTALTASASTANPSCIGVCNGSIDISSNGGTGVHTYLWSSTAATQDVSGLCAGSYTVTITDANSCTSQQTYNLSNAYTFSISSATAAAVNCFGGNTGNITVNLSGGTSPITYSWSNGATAQNLSNVTAGTFTVTATDNNGCKSSASAVITQPVAALTTSISASGNVSCFGLTNGYATVSASGGTTPYTYNWSNGSTASTNSNLIAGSYTVTVTDANGCTSQNSISITQPAAALSANASSTTNVLCFGNNTGAINVSISGGTTPYNYNWSNGSTTQNINSLIAGSYTVTVTDAQSCTTTLSGTITQPSATLNSSISSSIDATCFGFSNGSATASANGGTSPYIYNWSNGSSLATMSNVTAGNYSVTITDANGCTNQSSIVISQPSAALSSSISSSSNVTCFGLSNGSATVTSSGGTVPYTYNWSNGATTATCSGLIAGTYTVTVTDSKGCSSQNTISIIQPSASLSASASSTTNVLCFGNATGAIDLTVAGGTTPYNYNWSNGTSSQDLNTVAAGTYSVTITDAQNCTTTLTTNITQPSAALSTTITSASDVSCFGLSNGSATVTASGGTMPYSYNWSNGAITSTMSNVPNGTYTVIVTDANGCTSQSTVSITQPAATLSATSSKTDVLCFGNNSGAAILSVAGGTSPYTYSWSNGSSSSSVSNLIAGVYTATVTDSNGCSTVNTVAITQPVAALSITTSRTNVLCFGNSTGTISTAVSGGTSPYTYNWNNGASTSSLSGIMAGTYTLTVTDANNCVSTSGSLTITQPSAALSQSAAITNVGCHGNATGAINVNATGGTTPYNYNWSNGVSTANNSNINSGNYTLTITDANNCVATNSYTVTQPVAALSTSGTVNDVKCFGNSTGSIALIASGGTAPYTYSWSHGSSSSSTNNLTAGNYTYTITDANNCAISGTLSVSQPVAALTASASQSNVNCYNGNDGNIVLSVSGGTSPYNYNWNTGSSAQNVTNLSSGNYTVTITDGNNCTTSLTQTITQPSASLTLSSTHTDINCIGNVIGGIDLSASGGTTPYIYDWSNGSSQQDLTNLSAGTYTVTVTDANGCSAATAVSISQPAGALNATSNIKEVRCYGNNTGEIDLTASAGTPPYTYQWNNGITTQDQQNLTAGSYTVTITDANGCVLTNTLFVTQPNQPLNVATNKQDINCYGDSTGWIDIFVAGGTSPYSYNWNNNSGNEDLLNVQSGSYFVTVTDANSCTATATVNLIQPTAPIALAANAIGLNCHDVNDGSIDLTVSGGTSPYIYNWSNGSVNQNLSGLATGNYSVTITDAYGCTTSDTYAIQFSAPQLTSSFAVQPVLCNGNNTGSADITVNGGTSPYQYNWSNGSALEDLVNITAGSYQVTVTDANGCTTNGSINVTEPVAAMQVNSNQENVLCFANNTGWIDLTVVGGTSPYNFQWNNGGSTEDALGLTAGSYDVTVTDNNGCTWTSSFVLAQPTAPVASAVSANDPACHAENTGSITLQLSGGTSPYTINWSNGETTPAISSLAAGNYIYTITDANNCNYSETVTLSQPSMFLSANSQVINIDCFSNSTGTAQLNVNGGTGPYQYNWSNGASTAINSGLTAGTYYYTITDSHQCLFSDSIEVTQPSNFLQATVSTTQVMCHGDSTAALAVLVSGGTPGYSYQWNNGATTASINQLSSGTYTLTITDANNCIYTNAYTIVQPTASLNATPVVMDVNCNGGMSGSISLNLTGGTPPYIYNWNNSGTTDSLSNLQAGTYQVTATDNNGCTYNNNFTVNEPAAPLSTTSSVNQVNCFGNNSGAINITTYGGTAPYTYSWNNGATTEDLLNISSGSYTLTITDAHNCIYNQSFSIIQPLQTLANTFIVNEVNCYSQATGSIQSNITGGTPPYIYSWNNGMTGSQISSVNAGIYVLTVTDANGCVYVDSASVSQPSTPLSGNVTASNLICHGDQSGTINLIVSGGTGSYLYAWNNGSTSQNLANLPAGTYTATVTDANGCTFTTSSTISEPQQLLTATASSTNVSCTGMNNGSIQLQITGGIPTYQIQWNNGAITDTLSNLSPGIYNATITDANGCSQSVNVNLTQPTASLSIALTNSNSNCLLSQPGIISSTVNGGTAPYQYNWNTGATTSSLANIYSGSYTVTVTDVNGCNTTQTASISDQSTLSIQASGDPMICVGDFITLMAPTLQGVTYQWSYNNNPLTGATGPIFTTPAGGTYTVTVSNSCGTYTSNPIQVVTRSLQNVWVNNNVIICPGDRVQLQAGGGVSYSWDPKAGLSNPQINDPIASPSITTDYTVTITDDFGCKATATVQVAVLCDTLDIPTGYSPNNDGTNDYFVIDGLSKYPDNILYIYNRWGNLIYKKKEYDNKWEGTSNVKGIYIGTKVPNGTYYYVLDLGNGQKPLNGFVVVRR